MLNERSIEVTEAAVWRGRFRRPLHGSYCFAGLPRAVSWLLTGQGDPGLPLDVFGPVSPPYDLVVFLFLDNFGWRFARPMLDTSPPFARAADAGVLSRITSQFPSTTAAHVTTINSGLPVGQTGVYAWQYYEPEVGAVIEPLPFAYHGMGRNSLRLSGVDPGRLVPGRTLYHALAEVGVRSHLLLPAEILDSPCNQVFNAGARVLGHRALSEALVNLRTLVRDAQGPTYAMLYHDKLDSVSHAAGPGSDHALAEAEAIWWQYDRLVHDALSRRKRSVLLVSADHGQELVRPADVVEVNRLAPAVVPALQTDRLGRPLGRSGSKRDLFLHVRPAELAGVTELLRETLAGRADVLPTAELIAEGIFGPVSETFARKVGNLVILPHAGQGVWWYDPDARGSSKLGHHGGMSPAEMDIPLLVVPSGG